MLVSFAYLAASVMPAEAALVYAALDDGGLWRIYSQENPSSVPRQVSRTVGDASSPCLSWDKRQVAYEVPGAGLRICSLSAKPDCITFDVDDGAAVRPFWDTAGHLLFVHYRAAAEGEDSDLAQLGVDGKGSKPLLLQTGIQDYPDVSEDGRQLAYTSAQTISLARAGVQVVQQIWVLDLTNGVARQLLSGTARDMQPAWSPSGEQIAFASDRAGDFDIWVVGADGAGLNQLTSGPGPKTWPAWSPDGESLLFTWFREGRYELWLMGTDGANLRRFRPEGALSDAPLRDADWR